jgi:hypothetical protein
MKTVFEGTYAELQKQIGLLPIGAEVRIRVEFVPDFSARFTAPMMDTTDIAAPRRTLMEEIYTTRPSESFRTSRLRPTSSSRR